MLVNILDTKSGALIAELVQDTDVQLNVSKFTSTQATLVVEPQQDIVAGVYFYRTTFNTPQTARLPDIAKPPYTYTLDTTSFGGRMTVAVTVKVAGNYVSKKFYVPAVNTPVMGSISGVVYGDVDNSGTYTPGDSLGADKVVLVVGNGLNLKLTTDSNGAFKTDQIPLGAYTVKREAYPPGYEAVGDAVVNVLLTEKEPTETVQLGSRQIVVVTPPPPPPPTPGQSFIKGFCGIDAYKWDTPITTSTGVVSYLDLLRKWNIKSSRNWFDFTFIPQSLSKAKFDRERDIKSHGFTNKLVLASEHWQRKPNKQEVKDAVNQLIDAANGAVDAFEIGNEINGPYWPGSDPVEYINLIANPAYELFNKAGIKVIGPAPTWDVGYFKRMITAGLQCDIYAFHPYRRTLDELKTMMPILLSYIGNKQIDLTEWNAFLGANYRYWYLQQKFPGVSFKDLKTKYVKIAEPAMSSAQIISVIKAQAAYLRTIPNIRCVDIFIVHSDPSPDTQGLWKHSTGPLNAIDNNKRTTEFGEQAYAVL